MIAKVTSHGFQRNSHDFQWDLQDLPRISSRHLLDFPGIYINSTKFRARALAGSSGAREILLRARRGAAGFYHMIPKVTSHGFQRNSHDFQWKLSDFPGISSTQFSKPSSSACARPQGAREMLKSFLRARAVEHIRGFPWVSQQDSSSKFT